MGLRQYPLIAPEGWPFIAAAGLACVLGLRMDSLLMFGASATLALLLLLLFRDPARKLPSIPDAVLSPVDGRIVAVDPTDRACIEGEAMRIRIRINHFGAYTARVPAAGQVLNLHDNLAAGSRLTGQSGLWVRTSYDDDVVFLMGGPRYFGRPKAFVRYGERVGQGQRCAYVRLASHAEVYVPLKSRVRVKRGDYVNAGTDILATLVHK
jgi:phosphatidylserine decarboxylase